MKIILASASPRRKEILTEAGYIYDILSSQEEEHFDNSLDIVDAVQDVAYHKAKWVHDYLQDDTSLIIGADTIVVINHEVLGKPRDFQDAFRMLKMLQGSTHQVMTGVALLRGKEKTTFVEKTSVTFKLMSDQEIIEYIKNENVYDKAGSYAIQGPAMRYIDSINGDYYNVIGLPIEHLKKEISKIEGD